MSAAAVGLEPRLSASGLALALGAVALLAGALHIVGGSGPVSGAARACAAAFCVVVIPGSVMVLVAGRRTPLTLLEILGLGIPVSLCLVQVATIASLGLHVSSWKVGLTWLALLLVGAALAAWRMRGAAVAVPRSEVFVGALLVVLGGLLYLKGSPLGSAEDWSHAAIVRRLAFLDAPAIGNYYYAPGIAYANPLAGTHYAMALVSIISGLDALFVYQKMRFLWSISAVLVLYALARWVLEDRRVAAAATTAALLLTLSGVFADVPGVGWGQLATYSHPSDVALGVLLPGLLALAAYYVRASTAREAAWALAATLSMAVTLTMVHIRETVQFLVYLGSFGVALLALRGDRSALRRVLVSGALTVGVVLAYVAFHRATVAHVGELDQAAKAELAAWFHNASVRDLFKRPLPISVGRVDSLFHVWMPGVLLLSPLLCFAYRRRVLVWLPAASIVAYMLLIRFPVLSFPYVYLTYWEILLTPARNVAVFVHLLTGLALLAVAVHLSGIRRAWLAALATILAGCGIAVVMGGVGPRMAGHQDVLFLGVLAGYAAVLLLLWRHRGARLERAIQPKGTTSARGWVYALLVTVAALASYLPEQSPFNMSPAGHLYESLPSVAARLTPQGLIGGFRCARSDASVSSTERLSCPPSPRLVEWAARALPASAVLAADTFNAYPLPAFIPQQVAAWPVAASENIVDARGWYPAYYERFDRTMKQLGVQPFFNSAESLTERADFVRALGITHIVVDPPYQRVMARVLGQWPEAFATVYDDGAWTVYEVRNLAGGRTQR